MLKYIPCLLSGAAIGLGRHLSREQQKKKADEDVTYSRNTHLVASVLVTTGIVGAFASLLRTEEQ